MGSLILCLSVSGVNFCSLNRNTSGVSTYALGLGLCQQPGVSYRLRIYLCTAHSGGNSSSDLQLTSNG